MHTLAQLRAGQLSGITRLDLACGLTEFPREIFDLADSLEILNLSGNQLDTLPDDLHRLTRLRVLFCSDNRFTELPECLGRCSALTMVGFKANRITHVTGAALPPLLRWLILTDNCVSQLPDELGQRPYLQKLMLAGNRLQQLPASLGQCHRLELLRIAANQLSELPQWLLKLPSLSWLAYAGNPLEAQAEAAALNTTTPIDWSHLELQQQLGEGASGVIHQALWQAPGQAARKVAVKLYKGQMTSDGSPLHEMHACITAGRHPNLIEVLGQVAGHPEQQAGLVMALIEPSYRNLAGLPSLASCSRDVYADELRLSAPEVLRIAHGIASVAAHLHRQGITHGDLYGHNILCDDQGDCLLGILARRRSTPPRTTCKPANCNASKCGPSGFCWGNCWRGSNRGSVRRILRGCRIWRRAAVSRMCWRGRALMRLKVYCATVAREQTPSPQDIAGNA